MKNADAALHVRGESQFIDDLCLPEGSLHAAVLSSPIAHGKIVALNSNVAEKMPGVIAILSADHIPGENQIGNIILDEPLLADEEVHYVGQPIAIVVSENAEISRTAVKAIHCEFEEYPAVFDAREAFAQGHLIAPPRTFSLGDVETAWRQCDYIIEGRAESGGQEHVYLETQGAVAIPTENDGLKVLSATQSPSVVQRIVARVLDLPMHKIEVDVLRLGGGFGGKEDQATPWAALAALAAFKLKRPVKLVLRRREDMLMTGKRHPYSSDFKMGLAGDGKILVYQVFFYQNAGAAADLSTAILERTLFHTTNSYFIPNVQATAYSCRTNFPPNTAFRGFGAPQAMFVIESAIFKAAEKMGIDPSVLQKNNLLQEGDIFPYGMRATNCSARRCWQTAEDKYEIGKTREAVGRFNASNALMKKGLAFMPVRFGISFTSTHLNQASALVHVYADASVSISTAAVEMGQGVKTKIRGVAARVLSIDPGRIKVESTNTARIANMSPTAASTGADMNGHATRIACENILLRLRKVAAKNFGTERLQEIEIADEEVYLSGEKTSLRWPELINLAYFNRSSLSAQAHYATPDIHFDRKTEKGEPFAYHVFGTAIIEAKLDCLRGTYQIESVKVVHDAGSSLDALIDLGQVEGGIVQGIGWVTMEELMHDERGRLLTDTLTTYKVPDIHFAPQEMQVHFLEDAANPSGLFGSKAVGEPPFMYGIGAWFALLNAMKAFRPNLHLEFSAPLTPEKVLLALYDEKAPSPADASESRAR
jgi:xanthine dehydrogenase large subunit